MKYNFEVNKMENIDMDFLNNFKVFDFTDKTRLDIQEINDEIYNSDMNYNNCDKTSGQRCYNYEEINSMLMKKFNIEGEEDV